MQKMMVKPAVVYGRETGAVSEMDMNLVRMNEGRRVKKIFGSKPEGSKRRGRPRLRWLEEEEKDLWKMKSKRWQQKAVDREE
jgi:hypothetical protein